MSMHLKWNQSLSRVLASSFVVCLATTSLNAIPRDPCEPPPPSVCCEEPRPGPFAFSYPFDMDLNCPRDFYFHVDGLAMQAKQDGLEFAIQDSTTPTSTAPITRGTVEGFSGDNNDFDYNPGIRVGLGFYLDHDAWNLDFNWTWLNITNHEKANANTAFGAMIPLRSLGSDGTTSTIGARTSAKWDVRYNTIDVSLGKPHYVSRYLVMNPFFGARIGWIDQEYSVNYGGAATGPSGTPGTRTISHNQNDFWGIGTRAGINTDWMLGKGWCLFGNIAASILFGKFEIDQSYHLPANITTGISQGYDIDFDLYQNVPNFEIAIGIGWGKYFNKKRNHVALRAAYEFHEWWDQNNMRKFSSGGPNYVNDVVSRGNFTLNGFSLKVQFDI